MRRQDGKAQSQAAGRHRADAAQAFDRRHYPARAAQRHGVRRPDDAPGKRRIALDGAADLLRGRGFALQQAEQLQRNRIRRRKAARNVERFQVFPVHVRRSN
jgi:hypothetical protein